MTKKDETHKATLRDVVFDKMNLLENHFIKGDHLDPQYRETIEDQMAWISKMWVIVGEDDREWIQCAQFALEDQLPWK